MECYYVGLRAQPRERVRHQADERIIARGHSTSRRPRAPAGPRASAGHARGARDRYIGLLRGARACAADLRPMVVDAHEVRRKAHRRCRRATGATHSIVCEGMSSWLLPVHRPRPPAPRSARCARPCPAGATSSRAGRGGTPSSDSCAGHGRESGRRGSLRTEAHWTRLLASDVVPGDLTGHLHASRRRLARRPAAQVRALDLKASANRHERWRDGVRRLETVPGVGP